MERDKKLRSVTRTRFTKVVNVLDSEISKTNADLGVIRDKFSKLKNIDFKLKDLDQKMLDHMMVADAEEDTLNCKIEEAEHYSDTFIILERKVRELIDSDNKSDVKSLGSSNGSLMAKSYKLPKIEIRKFDGELINWLPFWAQFEKIHEDTELHDADKFHYLVQSMQSNTRARELIESYSQTAENYAKAVQALKQRYGQKDLLVEIYVRELLKLMMANVKTPPDERRSVAKLYDKLETQLRSLESLGVDTKENTAWLFPMIESCLPEDMLVAWQRSPLDNCDASKNSNSNSSSRLNNLLDFLRREVEGEERRLLARRGFEGSSPKEKLRNKFKQNLNIPTTADLFSAKEMGCLFCENNHQSKDCITAQSMPFKDKRAKIYEKRCCLKCLKPGHLAKACKRTVQCNICAKGHYVLLCPDLPCNRKEKMHVSEVVQSALANQQCTRDVTLMTLMVNIMGNNGYRRVRALLDPGSQKSYILESTALEVKLKPVCNVNIAHSLFGGTQTETKCHKVYKVALCSNLTELDTLREFEFLGQDIICGEIPRTPKGAWLNELKGSRIWLSDLGRDSPKIEVLIGSDIYGSLLSGCVKQLENGLTAIETHLGWTICGPSPRKDEQTDYSSLVVISMHSRNMLVDYLWDLETIGIKDPRENLTKLEEDKIVHQHFLNTVHQLEDGRFCVGLPWLGNQEGIPSNRHIAERRLFNTTRKLRVKCIFSEYDRVFQEWLAEGVIEKVSPEDLNRKCHYLPHHPVFKANSNTTKIRPVFDASCKDKGNLSLNDCLASGPNVIEQIPAILLKFREKAIGVIADIRKAFLQIEIQVFRHKRVVFGVTCSPYLLGAVILHHLKGVSSEFGALPQKLMECLYIDNCVTSVDTEAELVDLVEKSTEIFAKAKMDLRMWQFGPIHRVKEVYSRLPPNVDIERSEEASVLGMKWNLLEDTLNVTPKFGVIINSLSKRDLLSHTQQIFDPIGFLAPVLLPAKLLIQQAWTVKTDWDEPLPSTIQENFLKWYSELDTLADIKIPRRVGHGIRAHWSIHIFCDASQSAYAAAAFLLCPENKGVSVQLLMAKSRLGPLKKTTIPRMELLACMLGVRLSRYITESLNLAAEPVYYWTDSTTVLSWIKTNRQWGTFVNNRVKEICNTSGPNKWFYVPGSLNPADLPSRGCSVLQLKRTRWWEGPEWLKQPQDHWPKQLFHSDRTLVNLEIDRQVLVTTHVRTEVMPWFERFSNFSKIVRINVWIRSKFFLVEEIRSMGLMIIRDDFGLIRIKSKLIERDDEYSFRYPILLPTKHHVVTCLIREFHLRHCHAGVQILSAKLRENYWILNSRRSIRSVVSQCAKCRRFSSKPVKTTPIHLPLVRVRDGTAFEILGVDLAGPLYLKNKTKAWIVLFTCAVFRAIHLELVTSLNTEAFIQALRRFIARRGRPTVIYSDNGTNFVGANNALKALNWKKIVLDQNLHKISWKFIPPTAAWWGGWWERLIRSIKDLLVRILGHSSVYYEEMSTILCDVEATINSRPLTYIHEDFDNLDKLDSKKFQDRYRHCQRLREALRSRFQSEYLGQLVQKANERTPKLSVGDVVIVKVEDKRRLHWPMARIVEMFPGRDGHSRVAKVRTKLGTLIRPVQKLYPLEVSSGDPILRSKGDTTIEEAHSEAKRTRCGRVEVISSGEEEDENSLGSLPSDQIREICKMWETVQLFVAKHHPNKPASLRATDQFNDNAIHDIIFGWDFFKATEAVIDCGRNKLHLGETSVLESREEENQRLFASDDFVIPPKSIKNISVINEEICCVRDVLVSTSKDVLLRKNLIESSDKLQETQLKSREWTQMINLTLDPGLSEIQRLQLVSCLDEFIDIFDFGGTPIKPTSTVKHKINTGDHSPIKQRPYRVAPSERRLIQQKVNKMIENHIVKPSESPWSSPVILVRKKDRTWRFCVDYRRLNKITKKDVYPLPRIDDALDSLASSSYFSTMDLRSGYWQIEVDEKVREKTAFITPDGLYEFRVMPFGLCNASATFERMIDSVLGSLKWNMCLCYLDDIIVYAPTFEEHLRRLQLVLRCIQKAGLSLNHKKYLFGSRRIKILGHLVDANGIHPDPDKIEAVSKFPRPKNISELRSFLGLSQEKASEVLKTALISEPVLGHFDESADTPLHTDASGHGQKDPSGRLARWALKLQEFDVTVIYKSGRKHKDADCLSRNPLESDQPSAVMSLTNVDIEQTKDPDLAKIIDNLNSGYTRKEFSIIDGILYKKNYSTTGRPWLMMIPKHLRSEVMADLHDAPTAGHLGFARTYDQVKKRFYWPGLYRTVRQYVSHCRECQRRKKLPRRPAGQLVSIPPLEKSFYKVGVGLLGRFPVSKDGNRWIIVCTDYMTRYAITKAIPDGGAIETAKFLVEDVILKHGAPREMITDIYIIYRGKNFISQVIKEINALCGRGDRLHSVFIVHAREAETYIDAVLPYLPDEISDDYVGELVTRAEEARQLSRSRLLQSQAKDRRLYDQKHTPVYYQKDDLVWVFTPIRKVGPSEKLLKRYFGPYKVTKKLSEVTYEVEPVDPSPRSRKAKDIVHVIRMKPYLGPGEQHSILLRNTGRDRFPSRTRAETS
ncbi:hypothetical protein LAZ67_X003569 [Cordylochernes scorpioides]|uniref:Endonuclease n=1 Tax=Cordylochernes scorpioides TaxID=51811 RepID=A0ABY6LUN7_9ARAC|nr:hypothetical protein LAZ67_X003569 [Cordylochernes scorpioides]